jgi:hypothetical protein
MSKKLFSFSYILLFAAALLVLDGCSAQARQMRQTRKISKQNVKRMESRSPDEVSSGPGELQPGDINYKPDKIGHKCVHVNKRGKRCCFKAQRRNRYCYWHTPRYKV